MVLYSVQCTHSTLGTLPLLVHKTFSPSLSLTASDRVESWNVLLLSTTVLTVNSHTHTHTQIVLACVCVWKRVRETQLPRGSSCGSFCQWFKSCQWLKQHHLPRQTLLFLSVFFFSVVFFFCFDWLLSDSSLAKSSSVCVSQSLATVHTSSSSTFSHSYSFLLLCFFVWTFTALLSVRRKFFFFPLRVSVCLCVCVFRPVDSSTSWHAITVFFFSLDERRQLLSSFSFTFSLTLDRQIQILWFNSHTLAHSLTHTVPYVSLLFISSFSPALNPLFQLFSIDPFSFSLSFHLKEKFIHS